MFNELLKSDLSRTEVRVVRFTKGRRIGGKLKSSAKQPFVIKAAVQPLSGRETETLPEGRRQMHVLKLYTQTKLFVEDDKNDLRADLLEIDGETYEVFKSEKYTGLGLNHYKVMAARVNK